MTQVLAQFHRQLQVLGFAGAILGFALAVLSGPGTDLVIGGPALIVVVLEVLAITARRGLLSISAAVLRALVAVVLPFVLFFSGRPVDVVRLVDPNLAYVVLAYSSIPSVMGAVLRRVAR
jgi:hypothetical protein